MVFIVKRKKSDTNHRRNMLFKIKGLCYELVSSANSSNEAGIWR